MTMITVLYGRHGMSEHRIVARGRRLVTLDPAPGANPQGDVLVEARIGPWVITYGRRYGSAAESREGVQQCVPHQNSVLAAVFG
jgi:hypothetical protein